MYLYLDIKRRFIVVGNETCTYITMKLNDGTGFITELGVTNYNSGRYLSAQNTS
jgi:hypothetical protein